MNLPLIQSGGQNNQHSWQILLTTLFFLPLLRCCRLRYLHPFAIHPLPMTFSFVILLYNFMVLLFISVAHILKLEQYNFMSLHLQLFFFYEKNIFSCYSNVNVIVSVVILSGPTIMLYLQQALSKCLVREDTGGQTWKDTCVEQRLSLGDSS